MKFQILLVIIFVSVSSAKPKHLRKYEYKHISNVKRFYPSSPRPTSSSGTEGLGTRGPGTGFPGSGEPLPTGWKPYPTGRKPYPTGWISYPTGGEPWPTGKPSLFPTGFGGEKEIHRPLRLFIGCLAKFVGDEERILEKYDKEEGSASGDGIEERAMSEIQRSLQAARFFRSLDFSRLTRFRRDTKEGPDMKKLKAEEKKLIGDAEKTIEDGEKTISEMLKGVRDPNGRAFGALTLCGLHVLDVLGKEGEKKIEEQEISRKRRNFIRKHN